MVYNVDLFSGPNSCLGNNLPKECCGGIINDTSACRVNISDSTSCYCDDCCKMRNDCCGDSKEFCSTSTGVYDH